ncbi:cell wall-binding repeat-containing protein, partial [Mobiluncus mulieris]|uniref:cell wall-binding repeat-containing protein n=1 Tax=Mobiluncus mulieris TaxID=2052 RepID=UPI003211AFDB
MKFYTDEDPNKLIGSAAEVPAGKTLTQASVTVPDAAAACKKETGKTPTLTGWYAKGDNSKADVTNLTTTAVNSNLEYVAKCTYAAPPAAATHEVTFKSDDSNAIATVGESGKVTVVNDKKLTDDENKAALAAVKKVTAEQACKASSTGKKNLIGWVSNNNADNLVTFAGTDATANPQIASAMTEFTAVCVADATLDNVSFTKVVKIGTEEKTDGSETIKPTGIFYAELAAKTNDCPNAGEGNQHAEITGSGEVSFDSLGLKFSKAGECEYTITEHIIENKGEAAKNWGMPTEPTAVKVTVAPKKDSSNNTWSLEAKQADSTPVATTKLVNIAPVKVIFDAGDGSIKADADIAGLAKVEHQDKQLSAEGKKDAAGLQALAGKAQAALKAPDTGDKKFAGWALSNADTIVVAVPDTFTTAVTYKAVWAKDATVTFKNDMNSEIGKLTKPASSLVDTTITNTAGKKVDLTKSEDVCAPEAGKTKILTAWKYDKADGVDYSRADTEMPVADLAKRHVINNGVFTAVCKEAVTVTYVQKDKQTKVTEEKIVKGTGNPSLQKDGQYITPTQAGCASDTDTLGWKNKSGDSEVTAGSTFAENTTVYAECTASGKVLAKFLKKSGEQIVSNTLTLSGGKVTPEAKKGGAAITSEQAGCTATDTLSWKPALGEIDKDTTYTAVCTPNPSTPSVPGTPGGSGSGGSGSGSAGGYYGGSAGGAADSSSAADKGKGNGKKPAPKPAAPKLSVFDKQFTKPVKLPASAVVRSAGQDRVATSVAALSLAKNKETVVLATGNNFPDALTGGALAGALKAGVVLTTSSTLEQSVVNALKAQGTKTVYIVGGQSVVPAAKEAALQAAGFQVVRLAGADRYETAALVKAETLKRLGGKAMVSCNATGANFPDALACASAASLSGGVVDLVRPGQSVAVDKVAGKTICAGGSACAAAGASVTKVVGS